MKNAYYMEKLIPKLAAAHDFDYRAGNGSNLIIENPPYLPLMITAAAPGRVYVAHFRRDEYWGDIEYDPEIEFVLTTIGDREFWIPYAIQQPTTMLFGREMGGYKVYAEIDADNKVTKYYPRAQEDLGKFANQWAQNIRAQGFK